MILSNLGEFSDAADEHGDLVPLGPGARRAHLGPDEVLGRVAAARRDEEPGLVVEYLEVTEHLQQGLSFAVT